MSRRRFKHGYPYLGIIWLEVLTKEYFSDRARALDGPLKGRRMFGSLTILTLNTEQPVAYFGVPIDDVVSDFWFVVCLESDNNSFNA